MTSRIIQPTIGQPITQTSKVTVESDADVKLRERELSTWPRNAGGPAFGGKRKGSRAGSVAGLKRREWILLSGICILATGVRFHHISYPSSVV